MGSKNKPFGPTEEETIISLALDHPEFYINAINYIEPDLFKRTEVQYIIHHINKLYDEFAEVPTRGILRDYICKDLTVDDDYESVLKIIDTEADPRQIPFVKNSLLKWTRSKSYGRLYSQEAMDAYQEGNYAYLEDIIESAHRMVDTEFKIFNFFERFTDLWKEDHLVHYSTGYKTLDKYLGSGKGPSPSEVLLWLAATNVGKSIMLCNNAVNSVMSGLDTVFISFEMSDLKIAKRCTAAFSEFGMPEFGDKKGEIVNRIKTIEKSSRANFALVTFPPDECSVDHIYAVLAEIKRRFGWRPKILCIDYLELMMSRRASMNDDDYRRQKHVATEVCGLGKNENVLIYSATQGNRSSTNPNGPIDLQNMAESYGKAMPVDYVISLNQTREQYDALPPRISFFIAKNREGDKRKVIECTVNYNMMKVKEFDEAA